MITFTTPVTPLLREFCIFMASTTAHSWPSPTFSPKATLTAFTTPGIGDRMTRLVSMGTLTGITSSRAAASEGRTRHSSAVPLYLRRR